MKRHILIATALVALGSPVFAQSQGEWTIGIGVAHVDPKSDNGTLAGGTVPTSIGSSMSQSPVSWPRQPDMPTVVSPPGRAMQSCAAVPMQMRRSSAVAPAPLSPAARSRQADRRPSS